MSKTIFEQIKDCPHNMVAVLDLRRPVADYLECIIELYHLGLMSADHTDKIMLEVETAFKIRVQQIRNTLLN